MSKVEITGPRGQLLPVLETIQKSEVLQIDPDIRRRIDLGSDPISQVRPLALDGKTLAERLFLEDLNLKVERSASTSTPQRSAAGAASRCRASSPRSIATSCS